MKVILSTLNSKFIHSSLSIRYLREYVKELIPIELKEYTINQNIDFIVSELHGLQADLIGFSTYIWNVDEIIKISKAIKIVNPKIKILLGGPEVSYDGKKTLEENPHIDYIIYGEGEQSFKELIEVLVKKQKSFSDVKGLIYWEEGKVIQNAPRSLINELDKIPTPYKNISDEFENKIVYFESSRGCPFNCRFCLSSTIRGVRYFPIERVKKELDNLIDSKVKQVKFVDRTFNANKRYSMEIMNHIMKRNPSGINFHFEVTAHLLDEEMLEFLSNAKERLFQFEVGVQSTNPLTIDAIGRTTDLEKLKIVTKKIKSYENIHQHLDLIAGLPFEDYDSFKNSFNDVYEIRPEKIQLGFLKLLKGSKLREEENKYGFKYLDTPPYEVLETNYIDYNHIVELKRIEDIVEKYYNEGYFKHSLEYIIKNNHSNPFELFEELAKYWVLKEYHHVSNSRTKLYEILANYYKYKKFDGFKVFKELIRFDFVSNNISSKMPDIIKSIDQDIKNINIHNVLKDERVLNNYIREYKDIPTKKLIKHTKVQRFYVDVFKIIQNGYIHVEGSKEIDVLFIYREDGIKRCRTYDISNITKELI